MVSRVFVALLMAAFLKLEFFSVDANEVVKRSYEAQLLERLIQYEIEMRLMKTDVQKLQDTVKKLDANCSIPLVAFTAYNPTHWTPQKGQIIVFRNVYMNVGGGYDTTNGIFTAPVSGLYQFTAHFCNAAKKAFAYGIYTGGSRIAASTVMDSSDSGCGSVTTVTVLRIRQTVSVRGDYEYNQLMDNYHRESSFVGVLIHL